MKYLNTFLIKATKTLSYCTRKDSKIQINFFIDSLITNPKKRYINFCPIPKPHVFSSISLQSSGVGTDKMQQWLSSKRKLVQELQEVKQDYSALRMEFKEAKAVSNLCGLVEDSKNSAIGPMKQQYPDFFDELSGNTTKEGAEQVVSYLKGELSNLKVQTERIEMKIQNIESKMKASESSDVNSIVLFLVRPFNSFVCLRPLLNNVIVYFSLWLRIIWLLVSISFIFPILDFPCILHNIVDYLESFIRYEIAISLPLFIWSFYRYSKNIKRYLAITETIIHFCKTSHYTDIWILLLMFTVTIVFF